MSNGGFLLHSYKYLEYYHDKNTLGFTNDFVCCNDPNKQCD